MIYFISYDVSNPKRLNKVAKTLENFGIRIQFSFFECEMEKEQLEKLKSSLLEILAVLGFLYTKLTQVNISYRPTKLRRINASTLHPS